ncbi:unnamed protein product [Malus baccata var. baccata]
MKILGLIGNSLIFFLRIKQRQTPKTLSKMMEMDLDRISNLPCHVIDQILSCLLIRYISAMLPQLVFDNHCVSLQNQSTFVNIVDHVLLLHIGPVHKFKLSNRDFLATTDIDRRILHLSRSSLFNCLLKPPSTFKGFKSLKSLDFQHVTLAQDVFENMVLRCPLLEKLTVMNFDGFSHLNIDAPNLQFFDMGGKFEDVNFKSTSNLAVVSIGLYEHVGNSYRRHPSSSSNLLMFLAHLPVLFYPSFPFQHLAIGPVPGKLPQQCLVLNYLSLRISFNDLDEVLIAVCILKSSHALQELEILLGENWNCPIIQLRLVKLNDILGTKRELEFIRFLLLSSPALEKITVKPASACLGAGRDSLCRPMIHQSTPDISTTQNPLTLPIFPNINTQDTTFSLSLSNTLSLIKTFQTAVFELRHMDVGNDNQNTPLLVSNHSGHEDGGEKKVGFVKQYGIESKKLWKIAGPAIFTSLCQYSLGALTQTFAGFVGDLELAAVSIENSVIAGLAFGVMLGMGSALETLCGQAYGAGQIRMLGVYMQRSWIILLVTACAMVPIYVWSPPILKLFGETTEISEAAGRFALLMLPQLFAYALNFPIQKFLQAQRKVSVIAWISAITLNASWWLIIIGQLLYIFITKSDGAWSGFSWLAFSDLWGFIKLSLASAVMLCLEFWYLMILLVITGRLKNPLIPVDAISICMNINGWDAMIAIGFNAAISVRVSNELGAGNSQMAKFAVIVVSTTSIAIGVVCMTVVLTTRDYFPYLFTSSVAVAKETTNLAILLGFTVLLNSLQPVLSGVAVGAGWQTLVAYINIGCYYIVGLPAGILLGFTFKFGVEGIWGGMIGGIVLQTMILIVVTSLTNWKKEADEAESRVRKWGGGGRDADM